MMYTVLIYTVGILGYQESDAFKVELHLPPKLKDADTTNSESFWHVLDHGYIAVHGGRCEATILSSVEAHRAGDAGWSVRLMDLTDESSGWRYGAKKLVLLISNMFDVHGRVRSLGTGALINYSIKMKHGLIRWAAGEEADQPP